MLCRLFSLLLGTLLKVLILPPVLVLGLGACVTTTDEADFGMQPDHRGYVPARIAILPCQGWPQPARFAGIPFSNIDGDKVRTLCASFDNGVIEAFSGQPYMRGFSPAFVKKQLDAAAKETFLDRLDQLWSHKGSDCQQCARAPGFYTASIAERQEWQAWLSELSSTVRNADAVLMPLFLYAYERRVNDRGLHVAERGGGVAIFLIDTGTGSLLWAGGRRAAVPRKQLEAHDVVKELEYPPWEEVLSRLFIEDLWRDFPGRQVF